ncbi:MAG TPA: EAL domain-containing protein [Azospira sp.]|nr:EAL domain-containing protein [Azospira sp.]
MTPSPTGAVPIYLGRQPILDARQTLFGYELLFRSGPAPNRAIVQDDLVATATVIVHAFAELGLADALGEQKAFINVDGDFLASEAIELLPREQVVLEILETVDITPAILERCAALKAKGFTLALDDIVALTPAMEPLLDLVDIAKICVSTVAAEALPPLVRTLARRPLKLLAEQVESREQMEHCRELGFHLFQGYYFARPMVLAGRKLGQSRISLLKLLALVLDDSDTLLLEQTFKQEAGLSINLLRMANSAAVGARTRITSLRHAITLLGRRQLQRWLQLLLYTDPTGGATFSPLLQLAATRARLLELLAESHMLGDREFADRAFMTGILSLTPALFGPPMEEILGQISTLAADVKQALVGYQGSLGLLLRLVEALESEDMTHVPALVTQLPGLTPERVNQALAQALAWTRAIGQEQDN